MNVAGAAGSGGTWSMGQARGRYLPGPGEVGVGGFMLGAYGNRRLGNAGKE